MKRFYFLLLMVMLVCVSFAAIDDFYSFNATTGTYAAITGTDLTDISTDDAISGEVPIGFNFPYGDMSFTAVKVSSNGWIGLGTTQTYSNLTNALASTTYHPTIAPLWDDMSLATGTATYLTTGTAPNRVFTVQYANLQWNYWAGNAMNFQARFYENGKIDFIYGSYTGEPQNASASIGINMSPGGTGWFYSITPGTVPIASTTAENTSVSIYPNNGTVYEFLPAVASPNDLQALSILGNTTPSVNTPTNYVVSVRNRGTNPQTTYQVQIVTSTGTVLASVAGQAIQPNQVIEYTIPWTPTTEGPVILRGKTILAGDDNPNNDQSPPLNVTVMPEGMVVVTIGDGNEIGNVPVDMFWRNSLFETIYYPQEIGMVGNITALTFYNSFSSTLPNQAIKIWLGTTQMENLSTNWIPSTQMTLVYDGTVNYSSGVNPVLIPLQTVYTYTGGNLVMMVNRPMDTQYYSSSDRFQVQTVGTNRSREIHADGTTYDPANPPDSPTISGLFPKTSIHMTPLGTDPITMINPTLWNVGTVLMNTTFTRSFSVINGGGGTLTLSSVSISGSPFFTLPNLPALPVTLATGQSYVFTAHYAPTAAGDHSATITLVDDLTRQTYQIPLTATALDPTIYTLPYAQNFDAVTAPALPVDWTSIITTTMGAYLRSTTYNPYSPPNCIEMYNTGDAASTLMLISPPYATDLQVNTSRVNFRGKASSTTATVQIGFMTDSQNAATFQLVDTVTLSANWVEYVISFAAYTGAGRYLAFKHGNSSQYETVYIDNVMIEVIPQNDLAAISIAGNTTPSVNSQVFYTVSVYNWGSNPQSNYQVKLFNANDVELSSVAGTTVAPATTAEVQIPWTPLVQGPTSIYGKVVLTGDQNSLNDASPMLGLTVMPEGMMVITVGSGNEQSRVPVDMYWMNSLFETLYYPTELGALGTITALSFYNNFSTNLPNKPTKIWLGSTQLENLSGGWIPSSQLTLVFDGTVNYPSGENTITIPLQTPFPYTGGNLVMMVNRPMDTTYFSSMDNFYAQTVGNNRALRIQADGTTYDPANPPTGITPTGQFPKTAFHMTPIGPDPIYLVTPTGRNFGTVLQNTTHNQNFTVMNVGGGTLNISSINITGSEYMTLQNLPVLPASLNTGQSITFTGRYNPTAVGNHTATITITDNRGREIGLRSSSNNRLPHTIEISGNCVDPTITTLPYLQNFDTVTAPALPVQWSTIVQTTDTGYISSLIDTNPHSNPNCVLMCNNNDPAAGLYLISPPYINTINTNTTRTKFWARANQGSTLSVGVMTDSQNAGTYQEIQVLTLSTNWMEYVVTFGAYQGTGHFIAFKHGLAGTYHNIYLDDVMLEVIPQNDLAALSVTGNITPSVGMTTNYIVSVFNWGSNAQNDYQVKLYTQADVEVGSVAGTPINPGATAQIQVPWTPATEGATFLYGKVLLTGDQNNLNDQSPNFSVTVQPAGLVVLTIGDGNEEARIPLDMYYMNSLYETLYYPAELSNTIGTIYGIGLYNNFQNDLNLPTKIWMGTTTQADLTGGYIPSTQLQLVFDGTVHYPTGENLVNIPFQTPFLYLNGENLVVMMNRPMDTQYYSSMDRFKVQTVGTNRARNAYADGTPYDPASPPTGTLMGQFPKTSLFIIPGGVGHLNGTILGAGNQPLPGVLIQFATGGYTAITDANGQYTIQNIIHDTYQVSFSIHGYITHTQQVVIPEDTTVTLDLTMNQMPMVTVSGTIVASDTGSGINGAGFHLVGYENYTTTTNPQGQFSINTVYAEHAYEYTIVAPGYQNAAGTINVGATNYLMGNIVLNEVAYAPRQVQAEINDINTATTVSWQPPDPTALDLSQDFEETPFPSNDWTQVITNTGEANTSGVFPTWCNFGSITISGVPTGPHSGNYQAGLWWSYDYQDEWLITPLFNCPPSAYLRFWSHVFYGSENGDHYYIKISTDGGTNWSVLWDASAQTGGWNSYASPITLDLSMYEGLQVKLAWHAEDPESNDGLWYVWFIDDVYIGNEVTAVCFSQDDFVTKSASGRSALSPGLSTSISPVWGLGNPLPSRNQAINPSVYEPRIEASPGRIRNSSRSLVGYKIWRFAAGNENNEPAWILLTTETHTEEEYTDTDWVSLANGTYRYAVKAVYTSDVLSVPSFSNPLIKEVVTGMIAGVVRRTTNQAIPGATVTAGTYTATTNTAGAYSIVLPIGVYSVTATHPNFQSQTQEEITVMANQTTTVNFILVGVDNEDDTLPVVATALNGNYPNPFNPETTISFAVKEAAAVKLDIYNLKGQLIRSLVHEDKAPGHYRVVWNGKDNQGFSVGSGVYFYRMTAGSYSSTKKMLLME